MAPAVRKISAASARAHTRKHSQGSSFSIPSGLLRKLFVVLLVGLIAWSYQAIKPPAPRICGSPNGPPITSSRIKLKDGRHLSYAEFGVPKGKAKYKIIYIHGFSSTKHSVLPVSQGVYDGLRVYLVAFDRAGYGESDPNPNLSVKSTALDVEDLADHLELGSKFYIIGNSLGGTYVWGCLKYIPHRLVSAALLSPASNYWWPGFPANLSKEAYNKQLVQDQWALRVAHYAPWLTYWWNTQTWFPSYCPVVFCPQLFSVSDMELLRKFTGRDDYKGEIGQEGVFDSLHRDMNVVFGRWEFDPMELDDPFPNNEVTVQLWHGAGDLVVPVALSRYISQKLSWVQYHEIEDAGHLLIFMDGMADEIVKELVGGN